MDHNSIHIHLHKSLTKWRKARFWRDARGFPAVVWDIVHSSPEAPRMYQDTLHSIPRNGGDLVGKLFHRKGQRLAHNYKSSVHKDEGWSW